MCAHLFTTIWPTNHPTKNENVLCFEGSINIHARTRDPSNPFHCGDFFVHPCVANSSRASLTRRMKNWECKMSFFFLKIQWPKVQQHAPQSMSHLLTHDSSPFLQGEPLPSDLDRILWNTFGNGNLVSIQVLIPVGWITLRRRVRSSHQLVESFLKDACRIKLPLIQIIETSECPR